jgi:hypothetical protein
MHPFKLIVPLLVGIISISPLKAGPVPAPKPTTEITKDDEGTPLFTIDKSVSPNGDDNFRHYWSITFLKGDKNKSDIQVSNIYCNDVEVAATAFIGPTGATTIIFTVENNVPANEWEFDWETLE